MESTQDKFTKLENFNTSPDQFYEELIIGPKRVFNCLFPGCGKSFKFRSEIKRHLTIHSTKRFYHCSFPGCTKAFKRADALASHAKVHSTTSLFDCYFKDCDAKFTTKSALNYHLLKHGEKNFVCSFSGCNKAFRTYSQVKQHEKTYVHHKQSQNLVPDLDLNFFTNNEPVHYFWEPNSFNQEVQIPPLNLEYHQHEPFPFTHKDQEIITNDSSQYSPTSNTSKPRQLSVLMDFVIEENETLKKKLKSAFSMLENMNHHQKEEISVDEFFKSSQETENDYPKEKRLCSNNQIRA